MKTRIVFLLCVFVLLGCRVSPNSTLVESTTNSSGALVEPTTNLSSTLVESIAKNTNDKCEFKLVIKKYSISSGIISDRFSQDGKPTQEERDKAQAISETNLDHPFYARKWVPVEEGLEKRELLTPVKLEEGQYLDVLGCYKIETLQEQFKGLNIYFYPAQAEWIREIPHISVPKYRFNNLSDRTSSYAPFQSALYTDEDVTDMPITVGGPDVIYEPGISSVMVYINLIKSSEGLIERYDIDKRLTEESEEWADSDPHYGRDLEDFRFIGLIGDAVNLNGDRYKIFLEMEINHYGYSYSWTSNSFNNFVNTLGYIDVGKPIVTTQYWDNIGTLAELLIDMYGIEAWQRNVQLPAVVVERDPIWGDRTIDLHPQIADAWEKKGYIFDKD